MTERLPANRYWCFGLLAAAALAWDLISKWWVFRELGYPHRQSDWKWESNFLWGHFSLDFTTSFNQGALWGIGQGYSGVFAALSLVAAAFVIYWLFVRGEAQSWWLTVCLALIMAGTLGNLYDRLHLHGCELADGSPAYGVRDFLHMTIPGIRISLPFNLEFVRTYDWPIFNFADSYLVTGAIMLTLHSFKAPRTESAGNAARPQAAVAA